MTTFAIDFRNGVKLALDISKAISILGEVKPQVFVIVSNEEMQMEATAQQAKKTLEALQGKSTDDEEPKRWWGNTVRYSKNKDEYVSISEMNSVWLRNTIARDLKSWGTGVDRESLFTLLEACSHDEELRVGMLEVLYRMEQDEE